MKASYPTSDVNIWKCNYPTKSEEDKVNSRTVTESQMIVRAAVTCLDGSSMFCNIGAVQQLHCFPVVSSQILKITLEEQWGCRLMTEYKRESVEAKWFPMNCSTQRNIWDKFGIALYANHIRHHDLSRILYPLPSTLELTSRLTFPAVFITDLISLLQALEDFIWMYALTLYCRKDNIS